MSKQTKKSLVRNAAILSFGALFCRVLGALYRIPLYRLINAEGIGLYATGYSIYAMLFAISATGIPVAISKLVSEETSKNRMGEVKRIFSLATILITTIGFVVTIALIITAPLIAKLNGDPRVVYPLVAIAPAIFLVALMASIRGFFQGLQIMWPTAISQIVEQVVRIIAVLLLAWYTIKLNSSIEITAASATFGSTIGSLFGLIVIVVIYFVYKSKINKRIKGNPKTSKLSNKQLIKRILAYAIPITLGAMIIPVMNGIDTILVKNRLISIGYTIKDATKMYGNLSGGAMPLVNLPSTIANGLAASLVPAISIANLHGRKKEVKAKSELAIKLILIVGLPAAAGLSLLSKPISMMLYKNIAPGILLELAAFAVVFLTLQQACTGILQGLGHTKIPVINLTIGAIIKLVLNYFLIAIPAINIKGAAISTIIAYGVASILNFRSVTKMVGLKIKWKDMIIRPLLATALMTLVTSFSYNYVSSLGISNLIATLLSVGLGVGFFGIGVILTKCFTESELNMIPYVGNTIIAIASKLKLLRKE
ncbi:polysaccharide biosynthesis protein [Clostridium sp. 'deep sea']|uniref:putative polysaccharide biosynthesis protein n=1 Tax=Clostridium sp. 'deep sea' TaxID=2779445 RepID=UPI0018965960|nr:polysaccharide biosynthesis protein [Clostridium sp. 'deep sea']QOR34515.1 polysaccharide biosynthesis protein [Clostridium sp. 'deep sea']